MQSRLPVLLSSLALVLTACSDDVATTTPLGTACKITERVRLAAPPEGWAPEADGEYLLHRFEDFVLYTFDDRQDPERLYWRLDPCTGESTPFPSLAPGLQSPFIVETPAGRVLYAKKGDVRYAVDRIDEPGDDVAREVAGLPRSGWLEFDELWNMYGAPYAVFFRDQNLYSHTGAAADPALQVAADISSSFAYENAVLVTDPTGVRRVDPRTGASELVLAARSAHIIEPGGSPVDARVIWQPVGESTLYVRRIADGEDVALEIDSALVDAGIEPQFGTWPGLHRRVMTFADPLDTGILAAVRLDTGAAIAVPEHVDFSWVSESAWSLTLPDPGVHVEAIWEPETGALREWYRGPALVYRLEKHDDDHVDYVLRDAVGSDDGSLWRVDLDTGEQRQLLARMSVQSHQVDGSMYLMSPDVPSGADGLARLFDLEYVDIETGLYTWVAGSVSSVAEVPDEGLIYLDAYGTEPGVWVAPRP